MGSFAVLTDADLPPRYHILEESPLFLIAAMILGGFVALIAGGELLVRGASTLALAAKVSPLVIGLTVVALGTSAPEMAVSMKSCLDGVTELAIGNSVGSNISNILFVLGAAALVTPLEVHSRLFKLDIPVMVAAAVALAGLGFVGSISRFTGFGLVAAMVVYFFWTIRMGRRETKALEAELEDLTSQAPSGPKDLAMSVGQILIGLVLLVGGADFLVQGCSKLAKMFGIGELVIGLTITAIGTSLPEMVTSVMAALRGKRDLAVGNVVGSNILNILAVLGMSSIVAPDGIPISADAALFHIPLMVGVSLVCLPVFLNGGIINRVEAVCMFAFYACYIGYIAYTSSMDPPKVPTLGTTVLFMIPLLAITAYSVIARRKS